VVALALSTLEQREAVLTRDLAALQAGLERDEKFQSEIKNGLCPILSQKCLNLKEGETLEALFEPIYRDPNSDKHDRIGTYRRPDRPAGSPASGPVCQYSRGLQTERTRTNRGGSEVQQRKGRVDPEDREI
jgi:hypothetical protein